MYPIDEPENTTSADLFQEVAKLLAVGFLRLERRSSCEVVDAPIDAEMQPRPNIMNSPK